MLLSDLDLLTSPDLFYYTAGARRNSQWRPRSRSPSSRGVCIHSSFEFRALEGQFPYLQKANNHPGKPIKKLPKTVTVTLSSNGEELHNAIAEASGASVHRLRITKGSDRSVIPNDKRTTIDDTGLRESSVIHVKDLGTYCSISHIQLQKRNPMSLSSKTNLQSSKQVPRSHGAPCSSSNTLGPS